MNVNRLYGGEVTKKVRGERGEEKVRESSTREEKRNHLGRTESSESSHLLQVPRLDQQTSEGSDDSGGD